MREASAEILATTGAIRFVDAAAADAAAAAADAADAAAEVASW